MTQSPLDRMKADFDERKRRVQWQMHYDDWCHEHMGGSQPEGFDHDCAAAYADAQMEESNG